MAPRPLRSLAISRAASLAVDPRGKRPPFPWLGINEFITPCSHAGDSTRGPREPHEDQRWTPSSSPTCSASLPRTPRRHHVGSTTRCVLWCNEVGKGNNHAHRDLPFLLAGSCGGHFRTGRFIAYQANGASGHPHNNLLVSLAQAMGTSDTTFGDPEHCTGPLTGLTA